MVYWDKATGNAGTMRIEDNGSTVYFKLRSADSYTWINTGHYKWWNGGSSGSGTYSYSTGSPWVTVHSMSVSTTRVVKFRIEATGTSGLGGPTEFSKTINRASSPGKAGTPSISSVGHDSVKISWGRGALNGGSFVHDQVHISRDSDFSSGRYETTSGTTWDFRDLSTIGARYYVRVRTRNSVGYGSWSNSNSALTYAGAYVKHDGVWKRAVAWVKYQGDWRQAIPFVRSGGSWKDARS